jgi:hypothetical protein
LAITYSGTALPVANGGTGLTSLTAGYIPYGNGTGALSSSANLYFDGTNLSVTGTGIFGSVLGGSTLNVGGDAAIGSSYMAKNPVGNRVSGCYITTAGGLNLRSASAASVWGLSVTSGTHVTFYTDNGSSFVTAGNINSNGSTTTYAGTSDYRLKTNVEKIKDSGSFVDSLNPVTFTWTTDKRKDAGFLAHEFQQVSPNSVIGEKDAVDEDGKPVYQSMQASSSEVMANIVAELQSLRLRLKNANIA